MVQAKGNVEELLEQEEFKNERSVVENKNGGRLSREYFTKKNKSGI